MPQLMPLFWEFTNFMICFFFFSLLLFFYINNINNMYQLDNLIMEYKLFWEW